MRRSLLRKCFLMVICVVVMGLFISGILSLFKLEKIECQTVSEPCPPDLVALFEPLRGTGLFFTDYEQKLTELLRPHSLSYVSFHKKLPTTLVVVLKKTVPVYQIVFDVTGQKWQVLELGQLSQIEAVTEVLPVVFFSDPAFFEDGKPEKLLNSFHEPVMSLVKSLQEKNIPVQEIRVVSSNQVEITLSSGQKAIMDLSHPKTQVNRLYLILSEWPLKDVPPEVSNLDVRFELPVLK